LLLTRRRPSLPPGLPGLLCLLVLMTACSDPGPVGADTPGELQGRLEITGSSTIAPMLGEIAQRFEGLHPGVRIAIQTGGSSRGVADIRRGIAQIGMSSRELNDTERQGLEIHRLGLDGLALITHADNPVQGLDSDQVIAIFSGRTRNWSGLDGADRQITVINKADGRATLTVFLEHFGLTSDAIRADMMIGENQHGIRAVAGNPGAIGYVSIGAAAHEAARGSGIRLLSLDGVAPQTALVQAGEYPLIRSLYLVLREDAAPPDTNPQQHLARRFVDYARSDAVHDLFADFGYVPDAD